jgi:hypothetical protein
VLFFSLSHLFLSVYSLSLSVSFSHLSSLLLSHLSHLSFLFSCHLFIQIDGYVCKSKSFNTIKTRSIFLNFHLYVINRRLKKGIYAKELFSSVKPNAIISLLAFVIHALDNTHKHEITTIVHEIGIVVCTLISTLSSYTQVSKSVQYSNTESSLDIFSSLLTLLTHPSTSKTLLSHLLKPLSYYSPTPTPRLLKERVVQLLRSGISAAAGVLVGSMERASDATVLEKERQEWIEYGALKELIT